MPITDTNFVEIMKAKQNEKLAELMKNMDKKETPKDRSLAVVILAAGLGKRMKNPDKPKVMFEINGKPMIRYVIETALKLNANIIIPIVGHHKEQVIDYVNQYLSNISTTTHIEFAYQEEQLGTGHAVMQTENLLKNFNGDVLILSGDVPLLKYETTEQLIEEHINNNNYATMITTVIDDPDGYGRIIRNDSNGFEKIVENKDATENEKKIKEINPAIYIVKSNILFENLKKITPDNNQKEFYLTDIFRFIPKEKIGTIITEDYIEVGGVNSSEQLSMLEKYING